MTTSDHVEPRPLAELFDGPAPCNGVRWQVLHVKPRQEKALARDLADAVPVFLPLHRPRPKSPEIPLFPGYVFLLGDQEDRLRALQTRRVIRTLPVHDPVGLHDDLRRVHRLLTSGEPLTAENRLQPGCKVTITAGPLAGVEGTILKRGKRLTFLVAVDFLGRGVSAEVEAWMLGPVGG